MTALFWNASCSLEVIINSLSIWRSFTDYAFISARDPVAESIRNSQLPQQVLVSRMVCARWYLWRILTFPRFFLLILFLFEFNTILRITLHCIKDQYFWRISSMYKVGFIPVFKIWYDCKYRLLFVYRFFSQMRSDLNIVNVNALIFKRCKIASY